MSPDERQLIADLFERMRSFGPVDKDRDADTLIVQAVRATPDAAYKLVQSVLVQENALQESGNRIQDLEAQVADLQAALAQQQQPAKSSGGSFLGGIFGGSKQATRGASSGRRHRSRWVVTLNSPCSNPCNSRLRPAAASCARP